MVAGSFALDNLDESIVLDSRIRDWVLIPITLVMFLVGTSSVRMSAARLVESEKTVTPAKLQERQVLSRASRLRRVGAHILPRASFNARRHFLTTRVLNIARKEGEGPQGLTGGAGMDQNVMADMMKGQMLMLVPQLLLMGWVSYFFSGFVVIKLPFPLTPRFKGMLQRGVEAAGLDVWHVSSLSWYILNFLGLRGIQHLLLGSDAPAGSDDTRMFQQQMQGPQQQPQDIVKIYQAERENVELAQHEWLLEDVELRVMAAFPAAAAAKSSAPAPSRSPSLSSKGKHKAQ
eukprot:m51a1_g6944 putative transmembrane protein (289) ;mRNA; r:248407-249564